MNREHSVSEVDHNPERRRFLQQSLVGAGILAGGVSLWGCGAPRATAADSALEPARLAAAARNRTRVTVGDTQVWIPEGTRIREVARSGTVPVPGGGYSWHPVPDGGATFATDDGGWIYVSNSEVREPEQGGVGALRFKADGDVVDAYGICAGTRANCAGGPTPWQTWLSCEEYDRGRVFECDPTGKEPAGVRPALGTFKHEAVAVDPVNGYLFLTEDEPDGLLYRFTPEDWPQGEKPDLSSGTLEALVADSDPTRGETGVNWQRVPDPLFEGDTPTRRQIGGATRFDGGEGIWYHEGRIFFATKGDNRVWLLEPGSDRLQVVYDRQRGSLDPSIADVDNVTVSRRGEVLVAEDGPEMRLVVLGPDMVATPVVDFVGHRDSEICGPAFSPDGDRLYFSSQLGQSGAADDGRIYELSGILSVV
ncbi:translocation protein TolB [Halovibrio salipaludis]|uniref:Translocation protein TolB n=1 Tax=Halovibrio salipaludis TaxID=2032626 RepID=A0A2A2F4G3_9GAMM|nr:alkaline phosphatase PhoX [Halovibrio salipaludis]PAU79700.1 translocation protein TolB [Halovibrio salipaludis]